MFLVVLGALSRLRPRMCIRLCVRLRLCPCGGLLFLVPRSSFLASCLLLPLGSDQRFMSVMIGRGERKVIAISVDIQTHE